MSTMTTTPAQQAMETFTAQWYNTLTTQLGLDPTTFQLMQTSSPLGTTSQSLWNFFDAVPPFSLTNYLDPSQFNSFSQDYGAVLMNLKPQDASTFLQIMGDYYDKWATYLQNYTGDFPAGGVLQLFTNWADANIPDPATAQAAITAFNQALNGVVPTGVTMYLAAKSSGQGYAYDGTYEQLTEELPSAPSKSVSMDSSTASSDVSGTWAQGQMAGVADFFWGGEGSTYDHLTVMLGSANLTITATFQSVLTFAAAPLSQPSSDPILSGYTPWYDSAALALAYGTPDNTVWNNSAPSWDSTFGSSGNLQYVTSALVIVDGIDITITSSASFSSSDQASFKQASAEGIFPFFEATSSGGWSTSVDFGSGGTLSATMSSPAGNPQILGAVVTPIGVALGA